LFSSILGAISRDILDFSLDNKNSHRISRVFVSSIVTFVFVSLGIYPIFQDINDRLLGFISFITSFSGIKFSLFLIEKTSYFYAIIVDKILNIISGKK